MTHKTTTFRDLKDGDRFTFWNGASHFNRYGAVCTKLNESQYSRLADARKWSIINRERIVYYV